jgi:GH24 family phage-related lysozyme (muramidase)
MSINYVGMVSRAAYIAERRRVLLALEGPGITPYVDGVGWVTIGVGINLSDQANRNSILSIFGVGLSATDPRRAMFDSYLSVKHQGLGSSSVLVDLNLILNSNGHAGLSFQFASQADAVNNSAATIDDYDIRQLTQALARTPGLSVPDSRERLALLSLIYNGGADLIGMKFGTPRMLSTTKTVRPRR